MSLADEVAELRRRVADMVRRGVVDEVIPGSPVMVRVDIGDVLSPPLPGFRYSPGATCRSVITRLPEMPLQ